MRTLKPLLIATGIGVMLFVGAQPIPENNSYEQAIIQASAVQSRISHEPQWSDAQYHFESTQSPSVEVGQQRFTPGERLPTPQDKITAATGAMIIQRSDGTAACTGTAYKDQGLPFVLTAGHCNASGTLSVVIVFASNPPVIGTPTVSARLVLARDFSLIGEDGSVWVGNSPSDNATLLNYALDFPDHIASMPPFSPLICSALKISRTGTALAAIPTPIVGLVESRFAFPGKTQWGSIWSFSSVAWGGSSGSTCFNSDLVPVALMVGGFVVYVVGTDGVDIYVDAVPVPPSVIEGPELFQAIRAQLDKGLPIPKPAPDIPLIPRFSNWAVMGREAQGLWESAYAANEKYRMSSDQSNFWRFETESSVIVLKWNPAFGDDVIQRRVRMSGVLTDWSEYVHRWEVQSIAPREQ